MPSSYISHEKVASPKASPRQLPQAGLGQLPQAGLAGTQVLIFFRANFRRGASCSTQPLAPSLQARGKEH